MSALTVNDARHLQQLIEQLDLTGLGPQALNLLPFVVPVVELRAERGIVDRPCAGQDTQAAAPGLSSKVLIVNPPDSGVDVFVDFILASSSSATANLVRLTLIRTGAHPGGALAATVFKDTMQAGVPNTQTLGRTGAAVGDNIYLVRTPPAAFQPVLIQLEDPLVLVPNAGCEVQLGTVNTQLDAVVFFRERTRRVS